MRIPSLLLAVGTLSLAGLAGGCYEMYPGQGITNDYHNYVPFDAYSVGTGTGSVSFIANKPGTAYLIDWNRSIEIKPEHYVPKVIATYVLQQGQAISVDGTAQTITLGKTGTGLETVFKNPHLTSENSYELRFVDTF